MTDIASRSIQKDRQMSSSEDEGIDVAGRGRKEHQPMKEGKDAGLRIKRIVFDNSERLAVASFQR